MKFELEMRDRDVDRRLWGAIIRHIEAETAGDVAATLETVTQDCLYVFAFEGVTMTGRDGLTPYYTRLFSNWPGEILKRRIIRYWVAADEEEGFPNSILFEAENTFRLADGTIEKLPSAALLTLRGDLLAEEWIFVSHPTPWLREVGGRDFRVPTDVRHAATPARKAPDFAIETPYKRGELAEDDHDDPFAGSRVPVRTWFGDDGSRIVLETVPGVAPHLATQLSVLCFTRGQVAKQIVYAVRGMWRA